MPRKRKKMGRPPVDEKGRVYGFYADPDLMRSIEEVMQYTGGTVSAFLRDAVSERVDQALTERKGAALKNGTLNKYTGGSIEPQKN